MVPEFVECLFLVLALIIVYAVIDFSVMRQVKCSQKNENSLDMVLFIESLYTESSL